MVLVVAGIVTWGCWQMPTAALPSTIPACTLSTMAASDKDTETYTRTECRGPEQCRHDNDMHEMRKTLARHTDQLASGAIKFAEIGKDFDARDAVLERMEVVVKRLEEIVNQAVSRVNTPSFEPWDKVKESIIFWLVPLVGFSFLWVLWASKQIPGVVHP